jgi:hypothetical protein
LFFGAGRGGLAHEYWSESDECRILVPISEARNGPH